jgi:hypothetical protein
VHVEYFRIVCCEKDAHKSQNLKECSAITKIRNSRYRPHQSEGRKERNKGANFLPLDLSHGGHIKGAEQPGRASKLCRIATWQIFATALSEIVATRRNKMQTIHKFVALLCAVSAPLQQCYEGQVLLYNTWLNFRMAGIPLEHATKVNNFSPRSTIKCPMSDGFLCFEALKAGYPTGSSPKTS